MGVRIKAVLEGDRLSAERLRQAYVTALPERKKRVRSLQKPLPSNVRRSATA